MRNKKLNTDKLGFFSQSNNSLIPFAFSIGASAVYSSSIEGNTIDLDSFMNSKIGENYYFLNYGRCVPFLTMLPRALTLFV